MFEAATVGVGIDRKFGDAAAMLPVAADSASAFSA